MRRMLYRPNFCANCGEKIERADWSVLTSRRFCPVCESEYKGQDLIPRVIVAAGVIVGVLGLGSYLKSGPPAETNVLRQPKRLVEQTASAAQMRPLVPEMRDANVANARQSVTSAQVESPQPVANLRPLVGRTSVKREMAGPMYYCGAETKKGTPCSRRVKGNVRCYQHTGMPAMLTADKLKIN